MKRLALSVAAAALTLGFGACEKHSAENLPEHYKHKGQSTTAADGSHNDGAHNDGAHGEKEKAPAPEHKG